MKSFLLEKMEIEGAGMCGRLRKLDPMPRFMLGFLLTPFVSYYALLIPVVALGFWNNILTNGYGIALNCSVLLVLNGIGYAVRNPLKVAKVCGVLFCVLVLLEDLKRGAQFRSIATDCLFVGVCPLINGWLFERYLKADLWRQKVELKS